MLDAAARKLIDPPLNRAGKMLARAGVGANAITLAGFALGLLAFPCLVAGQFGLALVLLLLNRLADGLDGAVARQTRLTAFGGYLDITCDFLVWALLPVGFALYDPAQNALPAVVLLASFVGAMVTFLAFAILAATRGETTEAQGRKTLYYLEGLTEGTETIAFFVAMMLFPSAFPVLAYIFAAMAAVTTLTRFIAGFRAYGRR